MNLVAHRSVGEVGRFVEVEQVKCKTREAGGKQ